MDEKTIHPLLLCDVCKRPFVDPVTAADERRGCRACFTKDSLFQSSSLVPIHEPIVLKMLDNLLVRCTQCEETNILRGVLHKHEQNECKRTVVPCKAADIKCRWQGVRGQLDAHMDECVFQPLRPALEEIILENKQFKKQIEALENSVKQLREQNQTTKNI
jgi:hypothetical protein